MTTAPWDLLDSAGTVLVVHAHPDDESLATGPLIASLSARGVRVVLVTATRGEEGEVVPGSIEPEEDRPLEEIRAEEIDRACAALGVAQRHMLGAVPALAAGASPRRYLDSGMTWIREGLAGPSPDAGPHSFTHRPLEEAAADLAALIEAEGPDVVIGYDDEGTYGHPDHVRSHHVTAEACRRAERPMIEVASSPSSEGFDRRPHPGTLPAVEAALRCYRTQLTVLGTTEDSVLLRHVGGQDDEVLLGTGLRTATSATTGR